VWHHSCAITLLAHARDKGIARQFVYITLLLCTSCRASELHVCFSIDNSFSTTYIQFQEASIACSIFLWKYHFSVLRRAKPFIPKYVYFTLGVIIFTSATSHGNALYWPVCMKSEMMLCKYSYPMYWVSEHKSFDVCLQAADSKILVQLAIAIAWMANRTTLSITIYS